MYSDINRESGQWAVVIQRSLAVTDKILEDLKNNRSREVRDGCLILLSLVELSQSLFPESEYIDVLNTCSDAMHFILSMSANSGDTIPTSPPNNTVAPPPVVPPFTREVTFSSIIGSDDAKQSLFENVILPLSMSEDKRMQIFRGVRSGGGNVLLFGPPGTGMSPPSRYTTYSICTSCHQAKLKWPRRPRTSRNRRCSPSALLRSSASTRGRASGTFRDSLRRPELLLGLSSSSMVGVSCGGWSAME